MMSDRQVEQARRWQEAAHGIGRRVRALRAAAGLSQAQLAAKVDSSQAVIQKIENGKSLRPRILEALAAALDVQPTYLAWGLPDHMTAESREVADAIEQMAPRTRRQALRAFKEVMGEVA